MDQDRYIEMARKYEFMANHSTDYISLINRDYVYEMVNEEYKQARRSVGEEIEGKTVADLWGEKLFNSVIKINVDRCLNGEHFEFKAWVRYPKKSKRYFDIIYRPYSDNGGEITHALLVAHDITEKYLAVRELREQQETYKLLFENAMDGISIIDQESSKILDANYAWSQMYGYDKSDIAHMSSWDIAAEPSKVEASMKEAFREGRGYLTKRLHRKKDGTVFPVETSGAKMKVKNKNTLFVITRDTTERERAEQQLKKAHDELEIRVQERTAELLKLNLELRRNIDAIRRTEKALRESEERYRKLVETMNEGLGVLDIMGVFTYVNTSLCKMLGAVEEELIGNTLHDFMDSTNRTMLKKLAGRISRGESVSVDLEWTRKDGHPIMTTVSPRPIYNSDGEMRGTFALIADITKRKHAEDEVRQQKMVLEFKTKELEETNTALKVLLRRREEDKSELQENVVYQVKSLLSPHLQDLKINGRLSEENTKLVDLIQTRLDQIISPFAKKISGGYYKLSAREVQIASLITEGWSSKEIAEHLNISVGTVNFHRNKIRKKLSITNEKVSLSNQLRSMI
ncbi:MAG: PAS domain S-box protein [Desulfarculus sp.]|nr:PAS domain S-box protein [Pseudomonadota bacterium]MBU4599513.1 PAS domain S-box protein [Pseudomonadota bacterium]MBV1718322.1 PAS domain S-box protein [Desulfarculus sp.]MBV1739657.1 PAS domain S-box protein [Desulfarculus sp.]